MDALPSTSQDGDTFLSPKKKRPRVALSATEKLWVQNVYKYVFEVKSSESNIEVPKTSECVNKVAEVLGISVRTVYSVLKEHKENDSESPKPPEKTGPKLTFKDKLDDFTFTAVRRIVHQFFHRNEIPTIAKVSLHMSSLIFLLYVMYVFSHPMCNLNQLGNNFNHF